jgi:superfamily II DNA or RNA helicase
MSNINNIKQEAFSGSWELIPQDQKNKIIKKDDISFHPPRYWQEEFLQKTERAKNSLLNAPPGSGKSKAILFKIIREWKENKKLKFIIIVPETLIANSFTKAFLTINKELYAIAVPSSNDLTSDKIVYESNTKLFIDFLKSEPYNLDSSILVTTHSTFRRVYDSLEDESKLYLFDNTSIYIDECHHSSEDGTSHNQLGKCAKFLSYNKKTILTLITATSFRTDQTPILKDLDKFIKYTLPWDVYLSHCEFLKSMKFNFLLYNKRPIEVVDIFFRKFYKPGDKVFINIPNVNSSDSSGKYNELNSIIASIHKGSKIIGENEIDILIVAKNGGDIKILDFVNASEFVRGKRRNYLSDNSHNKYAIDIIISLNMFREGANYDYINKVLILGPRSSVQSMIQMTGRALRDVEGKEEVEIYYAIPRVENLDEDPKIKINNYLKCLFITIMLEQTIIPEPLNVKRDGTSENQIQYIKKVNIFDELNIDENMMLKIYELLKDDLTDEKISNGTIEKEKFKEICIDVFGKVGVKESIDKLELAANQIYKSFIKKSLQVKGIDISTIDIDLIKEVCPIEWLLNYTSTALNIDVFKELRDKLHINDYASKDEHIKAARVEQSSYVDWHKNYKSYEKKHNKKFVKTPTDSFGKNFWNEVYNFQKNASREEHIRVIRIEKSNRIDWIKHFKMYSIKYHKRFVKNPGKVFGKKFWTNVLDLNFASREEHIKIIKLENANRTIWKKNYKLYEKKYNKKLLSELSYSFDKSIWKEALNLKDFASREEHIKIIKLENAKRGCWIKKYKQYEKKYNKKLSSDPNRHFDKSIWKEALNLKDFASREEHIKIIKLENSHNKDWIKKYKQYEKKYKKNLYNITTLLHNFGKNIFDEAYSLQQIASREEHKQIAILENTNSKKWPYIYKQYSDKYKKRLCSFPRKHFSDNDFWIEVKNAIKA